LETRQTFSQDIATLEILQEFKDGVQLSRVSYKVPPPLGNREFIFLSGSKKHDNGTIEVWGCSVDDPRYPEGGAFADSVRARCFWGWRASPGSDGSDDTEVSYFSSSDPSGGIPNFFFRYAKTAVSTELINLRTVLKGGKKDSSNAALEEIVAAAAAEAEKQEVPK